MVKGVHCIKSVVCRHIDDSSFEQNFKLKTFSNRYNLLAELIPDYNSISLTFVKFNGLDKTLINIFQKV